jgi:hypothetical protein
VISRGNPNFLTETRGDDDKNLSEKEGGMQCFFKPRGGMLK